MTAARLDAQSKPLNWLFANRSSGNKLSCSRVESWIIFCVSRRRQICGNFFPCLPHNKSIMSPVNLGFLVHWPPIFWGDTKKRKKIEDRFGGESGTQEAKNDSTQT